MLGGSQSQRSGSGLETADQAEVWRDRRLAATPLAVVGLSGLFPMARHVGAFWDNVMAAADCIQDVPSTHWRVEDYYDPDPAAEDKTYCRRGGFIPPVPFAPMEFGLPPSILEVTGVVQLLSLMVARDVLRDAGCDTADWYDPSRTGVVLGVTGPTSLVSPLSARLQTPLLEEVMRSYGVPDEAIDEIAKRFKLALAPWEENSFPGLLGNVIAGRIANRLDLGGTNCTVDAACASSLAALRLAASDLVEGRADLMISGGCDTENTIFGFMCFSQTPAFSRSGQIRPFDRDADGTLIGEGIGMLALKRLADAERDGDRVYSVIRGIGSSSDGRFKSIYAPRAEGQAAALRRAYQDADCSPASVELFEAHATGTPVGDQTELASLADFLGTATGEKQFAAVGSVKSQIGHTKGAAGAASLIKLSLALYHKVLPPTINVEHPSPAVDWPDSGLYINTETRPWIRDPRRPCRRAAVSSLGFGGTNFHVVLEEHGPGQPVAAVLHPVARAALWHAASPAELLLAIEGGESPTDGAGIPADHARLGFVSRSAAEYDELRDLAVVRLRAGPDGEEWSHPRGVFFRSAGLPGKPKVAAVFAGQGSQYVGMGRTALLNVPPVLAAFDDANAELAPGLTLARVVHPIPALDPGARAEPEARLQQTQFAQPAIGAISAGQFRFLTELGLRPDGVIGHSFGELTALWAAGSLTDRDFFRLARARGAAMAARPGGADRDAGAMAAVQATEEQLREALDGEPDLGICNYNAVDQLVVGGGTGAVARFVAACQERGLTARRLAVSAAFHTSYVRHAVEAFGSEVAGVPVAPPAVPIYANTAGRSYGASEDANRSVLVGQLTEPVRFGDQLSAMYADGFRVFVEFGPRSILTRLVERTLGDEVVAMAVDAGPGGDSDVQLKQAAMRLALLGLPLTAINRYAAALADPPEPSGMTVTLCGMNYVPESRASAFQEAVQKGRTSPAYHPDPPLDDVSAEPALGAAMLSGYQVPAAPVGSTSVPDVATALEGANGWPAAVDPLVRAASDHLALHERYLESQLELADRLARLLDGAAGQPADGSAIAAGAKAVQRMNAEISRVHVRASELLVSFVNGAPPREGPPVDAVVSEAGPSAFADSRQVEAGPAAEPASDLIELAVVGSPADPVPEPAGRELDEETVRRVLLETVAEKTGYPVDILDPQMAIEADLGIDSIKWVQILGALREHFPSTRPAGPEQLAELRTLADVAEFILGSHPPAGVATSAAPGSAGDAPAVAAGDVGPLPYAAIRPHYLPAVDRLVPAYGPEPVALLVHDGDGACSPLAGMLRDQGWRVQVLYLPGTDPEPGSAPGELTLDGWEEESLSAAVAAILQEVPVLNACVVSAAAPVADPPAAVRRLAHTLLIGKHLQPTLGRAAEAGRASFVTFSRLDGLLGSGGAARTQAPLGGLSGLAKTLALEAPGLFCRHIDLAPAMTGEEAARSLVTELHDAAIDVTEVGLTGGRRVTLAVADAHEPAAGSTPVVAPRPDDLFVVLGGGRGVTAWCVTALASRHRCGFLVLGRTVPEEVPEWIGGRDTEVEMKSAIVEHLRASGQTPAPATVERDFRRIRSGQEVAATLAAIRATGATTVEYLLADVTDATATAEALRPFADRITGVIHGAGVIADGPVAEKHPTAVHPVLATKLLGLDNVLATLDPRQLRSVALFSSVAGFFGNAGQADYAMANEALNRLAWSLHREHPQCRVVSLNWGPWEGGMVTADLQAMFESRGVAVMTRQRGTAAFVDQIERGPDAEPVAAVGRTLPLVRRRVVLPTVGVAVERWIGDLPDEPVVHDHQIGAHPVMPATGALGWCINVIERAHAGQPVVECRNFEINKGIVFDGSQRREFRLLATPVEISGVYAVRATIQSADRDGRVQPHYTGTFILADQAPPAPTLPTFQPYQLGRGPADGQSVYYDGTMFHGPSLQGIRRFLAEERTRLVLECCLVDVPFADGAYAGRLHNSSIGDVLLQSAGVLGRRYKDQACMPLAIRRAEFFSPLPSGDPFIVIVDDLREGEVDVTCSVTACDVRGQVYQRLSGVSVVGSPDLAAKIAEAVTRRLA